MNITEQVIHGHHVSKDHFTPFIGRIHDLVKNKEGMQLLQFQLLFLSILAFLSAVKCLWGPQL